MEDYVLIELPFSENRYGLDHIRESVLLELNKLVSLTPMTPESIEVRFDAVDAVKAYSRFNPRPGCPEHVHAMGLAIIAGLSSCGILLHPRNNHVVQHLDIGGEE